MKKKVDKKIKLLFYSMLTGFGAGLLSFIFLTSLHHLTKYRIEHNYLIWILPFAGWLIGYLYNAFGKNIISGNNLILDEIHNPQKIIPFKMAPFVLVSTLITHLFGGSAGKEGTSVQMGGTIADQVAKFFKVGSKERKTLLVCGLGAGLGSAVGAPWAGVFFGMEILTIGKLNLLDFLECLVASFSATLIMDILGFKHILYPTINYSFNFLSYDYLYLIFLGVSFGITARIFQQATHKIQQIFSCLKYAPVRPIIGGIVLIIIYHFLATYKYAGLGTQHIINSFTNIDSILDFLLKLFLTALTLGSGFKGGEFTPLVFIGASLGSALSILMPSIPLSLATALGFVSVFGAAANAPLSCSIMAIELFGYQIAPFALISCYSAYLFSGHHGIYSSQKVHIKKGKKFILILSWFGELPLKFFKIF